LIWLNAIFYFGSNNGYWCFPAEHTWRPTALKAFHKANTGGCVGRSNKTRRKRRFNGAAVKPICWMAEISILI